MDNGYLTTKGRIFDIQRYSIHDGYGIRTIVFLKGCFLHCRWCCNPESQRHDIETMIVQGKEKVIGRDVTVAEVMEIVEKDRDYYRRSGGGMTLSGGEILFQPDFALALLRAAKERGISTAVESTACAKWEVIEPLLPYLKEYPEVKIAYERILENARRIAQSGQTELSIRVPTIPTFNATPEEIAQIAEFADTLPGVRRIHLLPYHRLGSDKYEGLGRNYEMGDIPVPDLQTMELLKKTAEEHSHLECVLGG